MPLSGSTDLKSLAPRTRRAFRVVTASLLLLTSALVAVAWFGMETLSQVRAYVGGEGRWSKAQKTAVSCLERYAASRDEAWFRQYQAALEVNFGDKRARLELDKKDPDLAVVREGFIAGGNAPADVDGMAALYRRFGKVDYLARCIDIWRRADGEIEALQRAGAALHEAVARGAPPAALAEVLVEDITERRLLQEQVQQAQRMEAVGQLAGGVAHDFNNLLTAILGSASLLLDDLPEGSSQREDVEAIHKAGLRASELTRQLLAFGRKQALAPLVVDLNAVVRETGNLLAGALGEAVALRLELAADLKTTRADPAQLEQVLVNLAVNARDAMERGGVLTIVTANVAAGEVPKAADLPDAAQDHVRLSVLDTGCGMDTATQARAFEPFFTTKPRGKGTGLGLSTVYGVVRQSGGRLRLDSAPGQGAAFHIYLPQAEGPVQALREKPAAAPLGGSETVLVVEDQGEVRKVTSRILRGFGHAVLEASSGAEALCVAGAHLGRIDLLATDVIMPGMSGPEVAAALQASRPGLRVLFISGYADASFVRHGLLEAGVALLPKPFTPEALGSRVRELLSRPA